jgi:hypothetical protein
MHYGGSMPAAAPKNYPACYQGTRNAIPQARNAIPQGHNTHTCDFLPLENLHPIRTTRVLAVVQGICTWTWGAAAHGRGAARPRQRPGRGPWARPQRRTLTSFIFIVFSLRKGAQYVGACGARDPIHTTRVLAAIQRTCTLTWGAAAHGRGAARPRQRPGREAATAIFHPLFLQIISLRGGRSSKGGSAWRARSSPHGGPSHPTTANSPPGTGCGSPRRAWPPQRASGRATRQRPAAAPREGEAAAPHSPCPLSPLPLPSPPSRGPPSNP